MLLYEKDNRGRVPLHYSMEFGHKEMSMYLATLMNNINIRDKNGTLPWDLGSDNHFIKQIKLDQDLLKASFGNLSAVKTLIAEGANANTTDLDGRSPMHYASIEGQLDIVKYLVELNVQIDKRNNKQQTPLDLVFKKIDAQMNMKVKFFQDTYDYIGLINVGEYLINKSPNNEVAHQRLESLKEELQRKGALKFVPKTNPTRPPSSTTKVELATPIPGMTRWWRKRKPEQ